MKTTLAIQQRLAELGFDPGPLDGIRGRQTIKAIRAFQTAEGLAADGVAGPITRAKLFVADGAEKTGLTDLAPDLPWFEVAKSLIGVKEVAGRGNNKEILDWAKDLHLWYPGDDIPWCGLFVAHCVGSTLPEEELPSNPLGARSWRRFGRACEPTLGCIMVFWREHPTQSFKGHVGFYAGEDERTYYILGGNQSDSVSIARLAKDRLLEARFPTTAPLGERLIVQLTPEDAVSRSLSTQEA